MAYKTEFQSNNADLQSILNIVNEMPDVISRGTFESTDSGDVTYKSKFYDNNIDLQKLLQMTESLTDIPNDAIKITYDANGGIFNNGNTTNNVYYISNSYQKEVVETKISKTSNILDDGTRNGQYPIGDINDIVTIDGAKSLNITIKYFMLDNMPKDIDGYKTAYSSKGFACDMIK